MAVEQVASTDAGEGQPLPSSSDIKVTDYGNKSTSPATQQTNEVASPHPDGAEDGAVERADTSSFTDESYSSASRPVESEGPTDFSHPAAVEEQRMIWLPSDPIGLVREIEQDLASQDILYSTEGAEMNRKGHVSVTLAPPEESRRAAIPMPSPGVGDEIREFPKNSVESNA